MADVNLLNGADIAPDLQRIQTQFILSGKGITQASDNYFVMDIPINSPPVRVSVSVPPGEDGGGSSLVIVFDDAAPQDVVKEPSSGYPYFDVEPKKVGLTTLRISGGQDNVHTYLDIYVNDALEIHNGSELNIDAKAREDTKIVQGVDIDADFERIQTQFVFSGGATEYVSDNHYKVTVPLNTPWPVRINVTSPPGEPVVQSIVVVYDDNEPEDIIEEPSSGTNYFDIKPLKDGHTRVRVSGGAYNVHAFLDIFVEDNPPADIKLSNGLDIDVFHKRELDVNVGARIHLVRGFDISLSNGFNFDNFYDIRFADDILISHKTELDLKFGLEVDVNNGARIKLDGSRRGDEKLHVGSHLKINAKPVFSDSYQIKQGVGINLTNAWKQGLRVGSNVMLVGGKSDGASISQRATITLDAYPQKFGNVTLKQGVSIKFAGMKADDLKIRNATRVNLFRGREVYYDDLKIHQALTITLKGKITSGAVVPSAILCKTFDASLKANYDFVCGQLHEIVKIPFDSSARFSVKLYSCDNKRVDVANSLQSATFILPNATVNGDLVLPATIDSTSNTIFIIWKDYLASLLERNRVYDMVVKVIDNANESSIILTQKLRFV